MCREKACIPVIYMGLHADVNYTEVRNWQMCSDPKVAHTVGNVYIVLLLGSREASNSLSAFSK